MYQIIVYFCGAFRSTKAYYSQIKFSKMKDQKNAAQLLREKALELSIESIRTMNQYRNHVTEGEKSPVLETYDEVKMHAVMCACEALKLDVEDAEKYIEEKVRL